MSQVLPSPWSVCIRSAKANIVPGLVLQSMAALLLISYYWWPATRSIWESIGDLKLVMGLWFSFVFSALFGGLLPFVLLVGKGKIPEGMVLKLAIFYLVFWAYRGVEVDLVYQLLGSIFGDVQTVSVIAKKVMVDQFVYSFLWSGPTTALAFRWKDSNFSFSKTLSGLDARFFKMEMPAMVISIWVVWLPTVCVVYALPAELQFPMFNMVLVFFVLVASSFEKEDDRATT